MRKSKAFTLIELLIVISIIGVLLALSVFGLQGARESARDGRRKSDLESIRSGIEAYKSDCNAYPSSLPAVGAALVGNGSTPTCLGTNTYISQMPGDPLNPARTYNYSSSTGTTYELCAGLENGTGTVTCGSSTACGSGITCNYKVINP
jgi:prepilin-type N-terminal cleavage/methylation domain-containing protein